MVSVAAVAAAAVRVTTSSTAMRVPAAAEAPATTEAVTAAKVLRCGPASVGEAVSEVGARVSDAGKVVVGMPSAE